MSMVPDISDRVNEFEVPMCPLCDDYLDLDDVTMTVRAHGATFTVHKDCYTDSEVDQ